MINIDKVCELDKGSTLLDLDCSGTGSVACLVSKVDTVYLAIDSGRIGEWQDQDSPRRLRWLGPTDLALWPTGPNRSEVSIFSVVGNELTLHKALELGYPSDVLAAKNEIFAVTARTKT